MIALPTHTQPRPRPALRGFRALVLLGASLALIGTGLVAGSAPVAAQGTGVVRGLVFDSTGSMGLAEADVVLWGTAHQAQTNEDGYFRLDDVPEGEYSVVFFHSKLSRLGVSAGRAVVQVAAGAESEVRLAVPSMLTIVRTTCFLEDEENSYIFGTVTDAETGVSMPRTAVRLSWTPQSSMRVSHADVETDGGGWFFKCGIPSGAAMSGSAAFLNLSSTTQQMALGPDGGRMDLLLGEFSPASVAGVVTDNFGGNPMFGVAARLVGTNHFTVSNQTGQFRFPSVLPGEYLLELTHLGYETRTDTVQVLSDVAMTVSAVMSTEPIQLAPIVVSVDAERITTVAAMGGTTFTREEVERVRRRSSNIADVLRHTRVGGLLIRREEGRFCVEFPSGQVRLMKRGCESVLLFVNNNRVAPEAFYDLPPDVIDYFVVFRPIEAGALFGSGSAHGAIMFFTKDGRNPAGGDH